MYKERVQRTPLEKQFQMNGSCWVQQRRRAHREQREEGKEKNDGGEESFPEGV
jgi:hypothetical protein